MYRLRGERQLTYSIVIFSGGHEIRTGSREDVRASTLYRLVDEYAKVTTFGRGPASSLGRPLKPGSAQMCNM